MPRELPYNKRKRTETCLESKFHTNCLHTFCFVQMHIPQNLCVDSSVKLWKKSITVPIC